jgi:hypothetical protein
MTIKEALENALTLLESVGYKTGGDIHDDLALAIGRINTKYPRVAHEELDESYKLS